MPLTFLLLLCALLAAQVPALAAPAADLVGKSVTVTWTENRQQRSGGRPEVRNVNVGFSLGIYISSAARPFTRLSATGPAGVSANEQVGGQGESLGGGIRSVRVDGRSIVLQANYGNFARNLQIDVAQGGGACSAQMSIGKQPGSAPTAFRNTGGNTIEIHSVTVTGTTCSIQPGNVFGR